MGSCSFDILYRITIVYSRIKSYQKDFVILMRKLEQSGIETQLLPREKAILTIIQNYSGVKSGDIAEKLAIPNPTVSYMVRKL